MKIKKIFVFISGVSFLIIPNVLASSNENIDSNPISVANYISSNVSQIVSEYNSTSELDTLWNATSVEFENDIVINENGNETNGIFIDFDADNGYMVVGENYIIYDITTSGENPYLELECDKYYYYTSVGYCYSKEKEIFSINSENNTTIDFFNENVEEQRHYDGQDTNVTGCGNIENTDAYVMDKYGSGYTIYRSNSLNMTGYLQSNLSCYTEHSVKNNILYDISEGNCWMVSAYNVLQYMQENYWGRMPSNTGDISYDPKVLEPNLYYRYFDSNGNNKTKLLTYNNGNSSIHKYELNSKRYISELYSEIRQFANAEYKTTDGKSIFATNNIIRTMASRYNYRAITKTYVNWGANADYVTTKIDENLPFLWSTSNDTYGSHTMAVCGYKYYVRTKKFLFMKHKTYKLFYELRDGHNAGTRYYDISGHVGFSAIITIDR